MRLPLPGPHDVRQVLEQLLAAGPRVLRLIDEAETLLERVGRVVDRIDATRVSADRVVSHGDDVVSGARGVIDGSRDVVERAGGVIDGSRDVVGGAERVVDRAGEAMTRTNDLLAVVGRLDDRLTALLDGLEPPLTRLQPMLERLASTTSPAEVDAMVELIDQMPRLSRRMEVDIMPVLDSLNTVAPDLHDLLDVSRELNLLLMKIPGMGRVKDKVDEEQEAEGRG